MGIRTRARLQGWCEPSVSRPVLRGALCLWGRSPSQSSTKTLLEATLLNSSHGLTLSARVPAVLADGVAVGAAGGHGG